MSSAAGERSFIVKAPSVTAPPCGLCLHQQPGSLSIVRMVPWVRIILSKLYFTRFFMPLLLISLFHRQRGSNRISLSLCRSLSPSFHSTSFSLVHPLLYPHRQIDFLHLASFITPAIFNSPRSPSKEPPSVFSPHLSLPNLSPPHACLSGEFGREKGAVIKDKDESEQRETNRQTNKTPK